MSKQSLIASDGGYGEDPINARYFRDVLSHYPTGVCAVTGFSEAGSPLAMVVGTFNSVSLNPPLVGFLPARSSDTWPLLRETGRFCINVLAADQKALCIRMSAKGVDRFDGLDWSVSLRGLPVIAGTVMWMECDLETVCPAGDHDFVVGRVQEMKVETGKPPLLFHRGQYGALSDV